jgi:hypothetical protein
MTNGAAKRRVFAPVIAPAHATAVEAQARVRRAVTAEARLPVPTADTCQKKTPQEMHTQHFSLIVMNQRSFENGSILTD